MNIHLVPEFLYFSLIYGTIWLKHICIPKSNPFQTGGSRRSPDKNFTRVRFHWPNTFTHVAPCPIFIIFAPVIILVKQFVETHSTYLHTTVSGYFIIKILVKSKYIFAQVASSSETFLVGVVCRCMHNIHWRQSTSHWIQCSIQFRAVSSIEFSLSV